MESKLSYFFDKTSLHGFKYLNVADEPSWKRAFARLFWSIFIAISISLMCSILSSTYEEYGSKSTSINLDTNYREWNNTFPAVSICMTKGRSTNLIKEYMENYWLSRNTTIMPRAIRYYRAIQSLMFINFHQPLDGVNVGNCLELNETCGVNMDVLTRDLMPRTCNQFMTRVLWLGRELPCEQVFKLLKTEIGMCFVANSLYADNKNLKSFRQLPLRHSNLEIIQRALKIEYIDIEFVIYKLFIHSPEELPDGNLEGYGLRKAQSYNYIALKTTEIYNQPDVMYESIDARQCRFPSEYLNEHKLPYSISNCHFNERMKRELNDCGCTLPIGNFPEGVTVCNITRYACTKDSYEKKLKKVEGDDECAVPSCLAMEVVNIGQVEKDLTTDFGVLKIEILNKPSLRYIRRVSITRLDMIGE